LRAPKVIYWLELKTSGKLPYGKKGGGKFTLKSSAETRQRLLKQLYDIDSVLYEAPLFWTPVVDSEPSST
jgi:hypothetical protein